MTPSLPPIGLIGLGNAGLALAEPLTSQYRVIGHDLDAARHAPARAVGVQVAASGREVADACPVILLSLPTPRASLAAAGALAEGALDGRLLVETSTVAPSDVLQLQAQLQAHGASVMDAAIIGGVHKLAAGRSTNMAPLACQRLLKSVLGRGSADMAFLP